MKYCEISGLYFHECEVNMLTIIHLLFNRSKTCSRAHRSKIIHKPWAPNHGGRPERTVDRIREASTLHRRICSAVAVQTEFKDSEPTICKELIGMVCKLKTIVGRMIGLSECTSNAQEIVRLGGEFTNTFGLTDRKTPTRRDDRAPNFCFTDLRCGVFRSENMASTSRRRQFLVPYLVISLVLFGMFVQIMGRIDILHT